MPARYLPMYLGSALATVVLFAGAPAGAQVQILYSDFYSPTEFNKLMARTEYGTTSDYFRDRMRSYFERFCEPRSVSDLEMERFECKSGICKGTRTRITKNLVDGKILVKKWYIEVV